MAGGSERARSQEQPTCPTCGDPIDLGRGRTLQLRHSRSRDAPALEALYERLSRDDLHRRFFTGGRPAPSFFNRWAGIEDEGGFGLLAALASGGEERLVGEAGYAPVPDGGADGELGIVVDPGFRGWLGPWLLDRLLAHAHERGVPNLQALVLVDNRAMHALVAGRGYATLGHPDWNTVLVTMATAGPVPSWGGDHRRPRVLIESDRSRSRLEQRLREAGFDLAICDGPGRSERRCPILRGERCPLVEGADAVVIELPGSDATARELIDREQVVHPGVRMLITGRSSEGEHRLTPAEVVTAIGDLLPAPVPGDEH